MQKHKPGLSDPIIIIYCSRTPILQAHNHLQTKQRRRFPSIQR